MHYVYLSRSPLAISAQGDKLMAKKPSKDEALEALDFIINVMHSQTVSLDWDEHTN